MNTLKLIRLEIEGFRRFRAPWTLDLQTPAGTPLDYLVLAGPNGCGKTTILEAILLALGREELIVRDLDAKERLASPRIQLGAHTRLSATLQDTASGEQHRITRPPSTALPHDLLSSLAIEYISSRRLPALVGPVQDMILGRSPGDTEANRLWRFKQRVRQQQGRRIPGYKGPEPLDQRWMEQLNTFWREFRPDGTQLVMTLVAPENLDANEWDLFLYQGDERICSVDSLSSGEQEILALVVPFITAPFDGLLLIDEPEMHLHPQWQGRALRALRKLIPNAQLIVATHADDPWDDAMSWERKLLVDTDDPRARTLEAGDA